MKKLSSRAQIHPFFALIILLALAVPMAFYGMYLYIAPSLPSMSSLQQAQLKQPLQVFTQDKVLIAEFGENLSIPVQYQQIPKAQIQAFLAAEDSTFFEHNGVSFKGLGRALTESVSGGAQTGGSTITMQVAKNYYLTPERTLKRKLTEIFLARKIEQNLTKEQILTLYVNKIFLGKNAYGIQAAAKVYYGKTLSQLTLAEKAMIAGLPKAPSKYNPVANPERALERRNWILGRMLQLGFITQPEYQQAVAETIMLNMNEQKVQERFPYLAEMVRKELADQFGTQIADSGFKVFTTVNSHRQEIAEKAVRDGLEDYDRRHGWRGAEANGKPLSSFIAFANMYPAQVTKVNANSFEALMQDGKTVTVPWSGMRWVRLYRNADNPGPAASRASQIVKLNDIVRLRPNDDNTAWRLVQVPKVEGQLIALNPNNGAVEAVVGGYDFYHSKFNRATQGWRQPGSTIKPFIYSLALERGMTPFSIVNDAPIHIGKWAPKNSDGRYLGPIPLRRALYLSRNTVSVRLLQLVGIDRARQFLTDIGLHDNQIPRNYTIALGTPEVLPIQMATGYAAIANGGYRIQPYFIEHIEDQNGNLVYKANPVYACIECAIAQQKRDAQIKNTPVDEKTEDNAKTDKSKKKKGIKEAQQPAINIDEQDIDPSVAAQYRKAQRILKSSSAFNMASILRDVIQHGTGRAALKLGRSDLGGKTGTTNDAKDAWFSGFNGELVAVTWVGFDDPSTLGRREYGGVAALPIWSDFMGGALKGRPAAWVKLDKNGGKPISHDVPTQADGSDNEDEEDTTLGSAPPMARPLYIPSANGIIRVPDAPEKPKKVYRQKAKARDFEDLPDDTSDAPAPTRPQNPVETEQTQPDEIF